MTGSIRTPIDYRLRAPTNKRTKQGWLSDAGAIRQRSSSARYR